MRRKRGQSVTEYTILMIIVLGAFVATSAYLKRGIQGRWRQAVDNLGEQYDPASMQTNIRFILDSNSTTNIITRDVSINGVPGYLSNRMDESNTIQTKHGYSQVGGY